MSSESKLKDLHKELFEVGLKNRREVVGNVYVNKALENGSSEFAFPGQELVTECVIYGSDPKDFCTDRL